MIDLTAPSTSQRLVHIFSANDSGWYFGIASGGYERRPFENTHQANWAFFPLTAILWRLLGADARVPVAAVLASNLFFGFGLYLLVLLMRELDFDGGMSERTVAAICFFPTSYFFSLPISESLFFLLSTGTFLAAIRKRWLFVLIGSSAACATRFAGLFLVVSVGYFLWEQRRNLPARAWVALIVSPLSLVAFMWHLHNVCGNAFAFMDIQEAWGRSLRLPVKALGIIFVKPWVWASDWNLRPLNTAAALFGIAGAVWLWKRNLRSFGLFLAMCVLAPLMTGTITSMTRYTMSAFPFPVALAGMSKQSWFTLAVILSAMILGVMCVIYAGDYHFAAA